jgi:hypothetical protein
MRKLASRIESELKEQDICAVYNSELARVWPQTISPAKRKQQIKLFAKAHRLAVTFYDVGLCAIFEKPRRGDGDRALLLPLESKQIAPPRKRRS